MPERFMPSPEDITRRREEWGCTVVTARDSLLKENLLAAVESAGSFDDLRPILHFVVTGIF